MDEYIKKNKYVEFTYSITNDNNEVIAIYNEKAPINEFQKKAKWVKADLRCPNILRDYLPNTDLFLR